MNLKGITRWNINIANQDNISLPDVEFIFHQSEKLLEQSFDTGKSITDKTNNIITLVVGMLIALIGFAIHKWENDYHWSSILITSGFAILYLFFTILYNLKNYQPQLYFSVGSLPSKIFVEDFYSNKIDNKYRLIYQYMSEIENYDYRISVNLKLNEIRWKTYTRSIWIVVLMPIIHLCVFFILEICHSCFL